MTYRSGAPTAAPSATRSVVMRGPRGAVRGSGAEEKNVVGCSCQGVLGLGAAGQVLAQRGGGQPGREGEGDVGASEGDVAAVGEVARLPGPRRHRGEPAQEARAEGGRGAARPAYDGEDRQHAEDERPDDVDGERGPREQRVGRGDVDEVAQDRPDGATDSDEQDVDGADRVVGHPTRLVEDAEDEAWVPSHGWACAPSSWWTSSASSQLCRARW